MPRCLCFFGSRSLTLLNIYSCLFSGSDNHTFILYLLISDVSLKLSIKVTFELLRDIGVLKFAYQFMFRKANIHW